MGIEFEAKFLDIDVKKMRKILLENGAKRIHKKKVYKRAVFLRCDDSVPGYSRVRKEGKDTTMTIKILKNPKFPEEFEVNIKDSFETGVDFLTALGIKKKAFQESIREKLLNRRYNTNQGIDTPMKKEDFMFQNKFIFSDTK